MASTFSIGVHQVGMCGRKLGHLQREPIPRTTVLETQIWTDFIWFADLSFATRRLRQRATHEQYIRVDSKLHTANCAARNAAWRISSSRRRSLEMISWNSSTQKFHEISTWRNFPMHSPCGVSWSAINCSVWPKMWSSICPIASGQPWPRWQTDSAGAQGLSLLHVSVSAAFVLGHDDKAIMLILWVFSWASLITLKISKHGWRTVHAPRLFTCCFLFFHWFFHGRICYVGAQTKKLPGKQFWQSTRLGNQKYRNLTLSYTLQTFSAGLFQL